VRARLALLYSGVAAFGWKRSTAHALDRQIPAEALP